MPLPFQITVAPVPSDPSVPRLTPALVFAAVLGPMVAITAAAWLFEPGLGRVSTISLAERPSDDYYLAHDHGGHVDHHVLYFGTDAVALDHMKRAWNHEFPGAPMEQQRVVITVPASFDEIARQLTLDAASKAGLTDLTLIEEPLAAFYAFIARTGGTARTTGLSGGERVLIADVGGGINGCGIARDAVTGEDHFEPTVETPRDHRLSLIANPRALEVEAIAERVETCLTWAPTRRHPFPPGMCEPLLVPSGYRPEPMPAGLEAS